MRLNMGFMAKAFAQGTTTFQPPPGKGHYEGGRWVPGEPGEPLTATATILPLTSFDLQYYEGGTYTSEDVKVIVPGGVALPLQTTFVHNGNRFEIREERDYEAVADLRRYVAKKLLDSGDADD